MSLTEPGRVLRLAVLGWGLGELALGHTATGFAWLVAEAVGLSAVVATFILFADTTWYLLPYLLGVLFLVVWAGQAVIAYRHAQRAQGAVPPAAPRSPALTIAWLAVPLLLWGTGFWLVAARAATPDAVMDRFMTSWPQAPSGDGRSASDPFVALSADPVQLHIVASDALGRLEQLCRSGALPEDCSTTPANLLRGIRVSITLSGHHRAVAVAELVDYERRPSTFLGVFNASELVPVPRERILTVELGTTQSALGAIRWTIMNAEPG